MTLHRGCFLKTLKKFLQTGKALAAVGQRCSTKKVFLNISQNSLETTSAGVSCNSNNFIKKETPAQVFSCAFREVVKNIYT